MPLTPPQTPTLKIAPPRPPQLLTYFADHTLDEFWADNAVICQTLSANQDGAPLVDQPQGQFPPPHGPQRLRRQTAPPQPTCRRFSVAPLRPPPLPSRRRPKRARRRSCASTSCKPYFPLPHPPGPATQLCNYITNKSKRGIAALERFYRELQPIAAMADGRAADQASDKATDRALDTLVQEVRVRVCVCLCVCMCFGGPGCCGEGV